MSRFSNNLNYVLAISEKKNTLEKDAVQIDKVKVIKEKLTSVLSSEYCEMPNFMARIPKMQMKKKN